MTMAVFNEESQHTTGPYYPLGTIGTAPRAYEILGPTEEWEEKNKK
jgi:hypothetical protein